MNFKKIEGLIAAPFTPMHDDGSLNLNIIPRYADFLIENGVKGVFICGSTGEGVSLTLDEKTKVMGAWAKTALFKVMLVGGTSLEECKSLARQADVLGFDAFALIPPFYFKPANISVLADCCAEVAAAAPNLPFYYYHIPVLAGSGFPMLPLLEAVSQRIPNFVGIKYTDENLMDYAQCFQFQNQKFDLIWGRDEVMISAMAMGAKGGIGSSFNYTAPIYHTMMAHFENGNLDKALEYQHKSIEIVRLLGKYGGIRVGKAFMKAIGIDCGHFRLPITRMFDLKHNTWHPLPNISGCSISINNDEEQNVTALSAGTGISIGTHNIVLFGGDKGETFHQVETLLYAINAEKDEAKLQALKQQKNQLLDAHPGFSKDILLFNIETDKWTKIGIIPFDSPVTTTAFKWGKRIIIPSGEIRAGVRTPHILAVDIQNEK